MDLAVTPASVVAQSSETTNLFSALPVSSHSNLSLPEAWKALKLALLVRSATASVSLVAEVTSVMVAYLALSLMNLLTWSMSDMMKLVCVMAEPLTESVVVLFLKDRLLSNSP